MNRRRGREHESTTPAPHLDARRTSSDIERFGTSSSLDIHFKDFKDIEEVKGLQIEAQKDSGNPVREYEPDTFRKFPLSKVVPPIIDEPLKYCIVFLHDEGHDEGSLKDLARRLQQTFKDCVYILLRAPFHANGGHKWSSQDYDPNLDSDFDLSSSYLLEDIILRRLIQKCHFRPRNIVLFGHGQGGIAALNAATIWNDVELGGVVAVEISLDPERLSLPKTKTPVLIVRRKVESNGSQDVEYLREVFSFVDFRDRSDGDEGPPTGSDEEKGSDNGLNPYIDFLKHRLRRDEWKKQDILSFDGGGIRGYGSLLILKSLMEKIAEEEENQDVNVESSFNPCPFRPIESTATDTSVVEDSIRHSSGTRVDSNRIVADECGSYSSKSAKFFPCHYFTYGAGTSTGGLISIMLFRLRMSVDECIQEYKALGGEVFGRPRLPVYNLVRPKFKEKYLVKSIKDVCRRRGELVKFQDLPYTPTGTSDDDYLFRCMTLAILHQSNLRKLYQFRTYRTPGPTPTLNRSATAVQRSKGYGDPSELAIWEVARATSAAPRKFAPITIEGGDGRTQHVFKDGGFGYNNPTQEIYQDVVHIHGESSIDSIVSIGTGETELKFETARNHLRDTLSNLKIAIKLPTMTGPVHKTMQDFSNKKFNYYRFDGGEELGKLAMDEWESHGLFPFTKKRSERGKKTLEKIEQAASNFLNEKTVKAELVDLAKLLVQKRRLRVRDPSEWDRFASCSSYTCEPLPSNCNNFRSRTANDFREHIGKEHQIISEAQVLEVLGTCRRHGWIYRSESASGAA